MTRVHGETVAVSLTRDPIARFPHRLMKYTRSMETFSMYVHEFAPIKPYPSLTYALRTISGPLRQRPLQACFGATAYGQATHVTDCGRLRQASQVRRLVHCLHTRLFISLYHPMNPQVCGLFVPIQAAQACCPRTDVHAHQASGALSCLSRAGEAAHVKIAFH